jgi:tetratricopeptide (TPR) repeat protein
MNELAFADGQDTIHQAARSAEQSRDWLRAAFHWHRLAQMLSGEAWPVRPLSRSYRELGEFNLAEASLLSAAERFPTESWIFEDLAAIAEAQQDWAGALSRWQTVIGRFPRVPFGYAGQARCQRLLGQLAEAEQTLTTAAPACFDESQFAAEWARLAEAQAAWLVAMQRWLSFAERFPQNPAGLLGIAKALQNLDRPIEAAFAIDGAVTLFPGDVWVVHEAARYAEQRQDWQRAERLWRAFVAIENHHSWAFRALGTALLRQQRFEEAEHFLAAAAGQFPDDAGLAAVYAEVAEARQDWREAIRRWREVETRFPGQEGADARRHDVSVRLLDAKLDTADGDTADLSALMQQVDTNGETSEHRTLMMAFESLGGIITGCEFGAVQRAFGADPLGLLRWSGMTMATFLNLLEGHFARIGEPDTTEVGYYQVGARREYKLINTTFGFDMHSHVYEDQQDQKLFYEMACRRLTFLRAKLLADLNRPDKIFLFKDSVRVPDEADIERLTAAMHGYGNNRFLIVLAADEAHPHALVVQVRPGLWFGWLDVSGSYDATLVRRWLELCQTAYAAIAI